MSLHSLFVERNIKWKYLSHMKQKYIYQIVYVTPLSFWRAKHNMKIFYWFWHSPKMSFVTLQSWKSPYETKIYLSNKFMSLHSLFVERNIKWKYLSHMKQKYIYQIVYVTPLSFWRAKHNMKIFYWFWHSPKMSFVTLQSWKSLCLDSHFGERD